MSKRKADEITAWGLPHQIQSLFGSELYSDLVIKCGDTDFKVHRAVVCLQSEFFTACMKDGPSGFKEAQTGVIDLSEDNPQVIEMMLRFLYTGDFHLSYDKAKIQPTTEISSQADTPPSTSDRSGQFLLKLTNLYIIADRFGIEPLKRKAVEKYRLLLPGGWESAKFSDSLELMFEQTVEEDRALKDIAVAFAGTKAKELVEREDFAVMFKQNADIGFEILKATVKCGNATKPAEVPKDTLAAVNVKGCPWSGGRHAGFIEVGKTKGFFCRVCKKVFNEGENSAVKGSGGLFSSAVPASRPSPFGGFGYTP